MKISSRLLMIMILSTMFILTLIGGISLNVSKKEKPDNEPVIVNPDNKKIPSSFKGTISDDYGVPEEAMNVITSYMDAYYTSLYTLEAVDTTGMFSSDLEGTISDQAIKLLIDSRKLHDFDFSLKAAHYDLRVSDYEQNGNRYRVDILEDDYFSFAFLNGIESSVYDIENYFVIENTDGVYKIASLDKVQGYYMCIHDEADTVSKAVEIHDYYLKELKDMLAYNNEILKVKAANKPYVASKSSRTPYNREAALAYADQYYHKRNPEWYNFSDEGGNCQNYASQCMLKGNIAMDYYGEEQWKCYIEDPDYDPEVNEEETANGRSRSWVNVGYFYDYAKYNEGQGLVAETNVNLYYTEPGDIILVGNGGVSHTVIVSKVVDGHILVNSNSIDMKDYPVEAYTYLNIILVKILGSN